MIRALELIQFATHGCLRGGLRTVLTVAGIAIASGALVSMVAFALGMQKQMQAPFEKLGLLQDITVTPSDDHVPLDDGALDRLRGLEHVLTAYPSMRTTTVEIDYQTTSRQTVAVGLPREAGLFAGVAELLLAGDYFSLTNRSEGLIGTELLEALGFASAEDAIGATLSVRCAGLIETARWNP